MIGKTNSQLSGGGENNGLEYFSSVPTLSNYADMPAELTIRTPYTQAALYRIVTSATSTNLKKLTIKPYGTVTNIDQVIYNGNSLEELTFDFDTSLVTNWGYVIYGMSSGKKINGILDMTNCTSATTYFVFSGQDMTFAANSISQNVQFHQCRYLTAETYSSIFAALKTVDTAKTITLYARALGVTFTQTQVDEATAKGWTVNMYN